MGGHQDVEFKTLDGLTLRGWLYPSSKRGPGIIVTPGVGHAHFYTQYKYFFRLAFATAIHLFSLASMDFN